MKQATSGFRGKFKRFVNLNKEEEGTTDAPQRRFIPVERSNEVSPAEKANSADKANPADFDYAQFQRKAYTGNFFAGPHCVFNPKLLG